jgi:hypothetical protein
MTRALGRTALLFGCAAGLLITGTAVAQARPAVPVHAGTLHPVTAPDVLRPGLVHLENTNSHELYVFARRGHAGRPTLLKDLNGPPSATDPYAVFRHFTLLDVIGGNGDVYLRLKAGTYYLADAGAEHYHLSDIHVLTVTGRRDDARAPHSKTLLVNDHNTLRAPATVRAGHFLRVRNADTRPQDIVMFRIGPRTTDRQLADFLAHPSFDTLSTMDVRDIDDLAVLSGERTVYTRSPARPGRFILFGGPITTHLTHSPIRPERFALLTTRA